MASALSALHADKRAEINETIDVLTTNLAKIAEHGRRADGIVNSMLAHSRGSNCDWQSVDLNALVEEALNLAYHWRSRARSELQHHFGLRLDRNLAPIEVVPQDVTRLFRTCSAMASMP